MADSNVNFPPTPSPSRGVSLGDVDSLVAQAKADVEGQISDISSQLGFNNHSIIPTYTDGQLTKVEEKDGSTVKQSSIITYNLDGTVATVTELQNGKTVKSTLNYVNGEFNSVSKEVL